MPCITIRKAECSTIYILGLGVFESSLCNDISTVLPSCDWKYKTTMIISIKYFSNICERLSSSERKESLFV